MLSGEPSAQPDRPARPGRFQASGFDHHVHIKSDNPYARACKPAEPSLLGRSVKAPDFLPILVALHLGMAAALLLYFWRDWLRFLMAALGRGDRATITAERNVFRFVVVAAIPAAVLRSGQCPNPKNATVRACGKFMETLCPTLQ